MMQNQGEMHHTDQFTQAIKKRSQSKAEKYEMTDFTMP